MRIIDDIIKFGKKVEQYGLISSHSGNISVREGDFIYITKTKTMLGDLQEDDIIKIPLFEENEKLNKLASMETVVHKAIFKNINAMAIIHTHPVYAVTLSLVMDKFIPVDSEGKFILGEVPILTVKKSIASKEVAEKIPAILQNHKVSLIKGHGAFAIGDSLEQAFYYTTLLETSSKIYYKTKVWISKVF